MHRPASWNVSALLLMVVVACTIADSLAGLAPARIAGRVALLGYLAVEWRGMTVAARIFLALAAIAAAAAAGLGPGWPAVLLAVDRAAFFATFMANQIFLRAPAEASPLVRRCGRIFIHQRPGRRYILLSLGGYLFGTVLSLGALSLLGSMIIGGNTRAAAGGNAAIQAVREQRMTMALLRGYSAAPLASPVSLLLAILITAMPGLHWSQLLPLGLVMVVAVLLLGWGCDRLSAPRHLPALTVVPERHFRPLFGLAGLVLLVFATAISLESLGGVPLNRAVVAAIPLVGLVWMGFQRRRLGPWRMVRATVVRLGRRSVKAFPAYRSEVAILAGAGALGTLFAAAVPADALVRVLHLELVPAAGLPAAAMAGVLIPALLGVNPLVSTMILAAAGPSLAPVISAQVLALALMAGWCLSINVSPLTASSMVLSALTGRRPQTITYGWNLRFSLTGLGVAAAILGIAAVLTAPGG